MKQTSSSVSSVYRNQHVQIRSIFERASSPRQVLCVALDYAKRKHVALCCDGNGDILKQPFAVENTKEGVAYLCEQVEATARRRKIKKETIFFGGEDQPSYVLNFISQLKDRGHLVARVNAYEASEQRENLLASTDHLDLLAIAKTLLSRRARLAGACEGRAAIYPQLRELCRTRRALVRQQTATSNRIHTCVDQLFPEFLNSSKSGLSPFTAASLALMQDRFSSVEIARRRPLALANFLRRHHVHHADETSGKLLALARDALPGAADLVPALQRSLRSSAELYSCLRSNAQQLRLEAAQLLASTPYAMLTSIPGIGFTLAAGVAGELGDPGLLPAPDSLCAYSGIVPRVAQSGGPDSPARHGSTAPRHNRVLKDWVVQSAQKIALYGPPELKDRMVRWKANGQSSVFAGARRYLRLLNALTKNEVPYLAPLGRGQGSCPEQRALAIAQTWQVLVRKWRVIPGWQELLTDEQKPIGLWRRVVMELHNIKLPAGL
jgi:transposase